MKLKQWVWACIGAFAMAFCCAASLESYWRARGFVPTFNDDKVLWAAKRKEIYKPASQATVFIGGSRIKFDLDIPTWERVTGEKAIQLAIVATPPRIILRDLANDRNFRGKLIIDVAEAQFFAMDSMRRDRFAKEALEYYYDETPAQSISATLHHLLESRLVFLEEGKFGLINLLNGIQFKNRPGVVFRFPFPAEFGVCNFNRQNWMTPMFLSNETLLEEQIENWRKSFGLDRPLTGKAMESFLQQTKKAIDKIRSRGGQVVFVRPPSNGDYLKADTLNFPRREYWDRLLSNTSTAGIHFLDYRETAALVCPELSHLSLQGAAAYTAQLAKILQEEKGWMFSKKIMSKGQFNSH